MDFSIFCDVTMLQFNEYYVEIGQNVKKEGKKTKKEVYETS